MDIVIGVSHVKAQWKLKQIMSYVCESSSSLTKFILPSAMDAPVDPLLALPHVSPSVCQQQMACGVGVPRPVGRRLTQIPALRSQFCRKMRREAEGAVRREVNVDDGERERRTGGHGKRSRSRRGLGAHRACMPRFWRLRHKVGNGSGNFGKHRAHSAKVGASLMSYVVKS